jgi:hypothetical protein
LKLRKHLIVKSKEHEFFSVPTSGILGGIKERVKPKEDSLDASNRTDGKQKACA